MAVHELKTDPDAFKDSFSGNKTFEIRYDDLGFNVGDEIVLTETVMSKAEMEKGCYPCALTGREMFLYVTYILRGPVYGLAEGWVIMGVQ